MTEKTPPADESAAPDKTPSAKEASAKDTSSAKTAAKPAKPRQTVAKMAETSAAAAAATPTAVEGEVVAPDTPSPQGDLPPASDLQAAKYQFPKMHPEGTKFVVAAAALAVFFWFVIDWEIAGWLTAGLAVWIFAFFRDPVRVTPTGDGMIVSPADGMVSHIVTVPAPRQIVGDGLLADGGYTRISVFMSVFDVHINRAPVAGKVHRIAYVPGKFVNAETDKASEDNERQYFVIEQADGTLIGMTQIAGLVARRIVKFVREGQSVRAGERIGLIRFGSRVDVFLPEGYVPAVAIGQRAVAGETLLATKGGTAPVGTPS